MYFKDIQKERFSVYVSGGLEQIGVLRGNVFSGVSLTDIKSGWVNKGVNKISVNDRPIYSNLYYRTLSGKIKKIPQSLIDAVTNQERFKVKAGQPEAHMVFDTALVNFGDVKKQYWALDKGDGFDYHMPKNGESVRDCKEFDFETMDWVEKKTITFNIETAIALMREGFICTNTKYPTVYKTIDIHYRFARGQSADIRPEEVSCDWYVHETNKQKCFGYAAAALLISQGIAVVGSCTKSEKRIDTIGEHGSFMFKENS